MDFKTMSNDELSAALSETREKVTTLFAMDAPTIEQVNEAEALVASAKGIEAEQAARAAAVEDAAERFAAAKAAFIPEDEEDAEPEDETEDDDLKKAAVEGEVEASAEDTQEDETAEVEETEVDETEVVEASVDPVTSQRVKSVKTSAAKSVAKNTARPAVKAAPKVTITAGADIPNIATGAALDDMEAVTKALVARTKGFAPYNARAAQAVNSQSGGQQVLTKVGVASFGLDIPEALTASGGSSDYNAYRTALKNHSEALERSMASGSTLTAAGWCAPSETVYSFVADYKVDGLLTLPEVGAPRGGIKITTGPARSSQGAALDAHGFVQTEAQAIAREVKPSETIVCPAFTDHRLDAIGHSYMIPLLTEKAYPELITDALRFSNVLYAHKVNKRLISDVAGLSLLIPAGSVGATFTDTLEALSVIATRRRRKWNVGENAIMEVKLPVIAREVFRADMSRRTGLALSDVATDQRIAAEFAARRLSVEYLSDWQEQETDSQAAILPSMIEAVIYPAGTFIKAVEDVINLSAVYDAASLSVNEYMGVFFEQGILVAKAAYGSDRVQIPVCTSGNTGAAALICDGGSL